MTLRNDRADSAALRGRVQASRRAGTLPKQIAAAGGGGMDPSSWVLGELMGLAQGGGGSYVGGTPGYTISRAAERAAVQGGYDRAEGFRKSNYADIDRDIRARNPQIQKGYTDASKQLNDNVRARALESRAALVQQNADAARAAAEMGLAAAPPATERAAEVTEEGIAQQGANATAWQGFNGAAAQTAVERNNAVGDTFAWDGNQQSTALANLLMAALAPLQDQYVPGTAGRMVGGTSASQRIRALGMIDDIGNEQFDQNLATAKLKQGTNYSSGRRSYPAGSF